MRQSPCLFAALAAAATFPATAAVHCVATPAQLQDALLLSAATAGDDEVRVVVGTYAVPVPPLSGFQYVPSVPGDLVLSGGWDAGSPAGLPPVCQTQTPDPALTLLDAHYQARVLYISPGADAGNVAVNNMTLAQGTALGNGGGLHANPFSPDWQGSLLLQSLRFVANEATTFGAGLYAVVPRGDLQVLNSVFVGNVSGNTGAALHTLGNGSSHVLANLTVVENASGAVAGAGAWVGGTTAGVLMNSVLWDNEPVDLALGPWPVPGNISMVRLHHNFYDTHTGAASSSEFGTLSGNPMLGLGSMGLTPSAGSPLVNHGLPVPGGLPARDVDANARVVGPAVDVGAFESQVFADGLESDDDWERPPPFVVF